MVARGQINLNGNNVVTTSLVELKQVQLTLRLQRAVALARAGSLFSIETLMWAIIFAVWVGLGTLATFLNPLGPGDSSSPPRWERHPRRSRRPPRCRRP